ncbi:hypothetical protein ABS768_17175 [Flavobacterium sp. ST-75]|uniref:Uncharacterized protein n=1 Tax=Flavobacterium rhizophilum TaxID=3163296 RepID=A0ABW8YIF2_9FLAO
MKTFNPKDFLDVKILTVLEDTCIKGGSDEFGVKQKQRQKQKGDKQKKQQKVKSAYFEEDFY